VFVLGMGSGRATASASRSKKLDLEARCDAVGPPREDRQRPNWWAGDREPGSVIGRVAFFRSPLPAPQSAAWIRLC